MVTRVKSASFTLRIYNHIQGLSMGFFHDKQTGQLLSRITADTTNLEPLIAHAGPDLIANCGLFFGSAVILFFINAWKNPMERP